VASKANVYNAIIVTLTSLGNFLDACGLVIADIRADRARKQEVKRPVEEEKSEE